MRDTMNALVAHVGGDPSETQRLAARRVAVLETELVHLEDHFASVRAAGGQPKAETLDLYGRMADRQRRLCEGSLGWQRGARDVTPTLTSYLKAKREEHFDEEAVT